MTDATTPEAMEERERMYEAARQFAFVRKILKGKAFGILRQQVSTVIPDEELEVIVAQWFELATDDMSDADLCKLLGECFGEMGKAQNRLAEYCYNRAASEAAAKNTNN